MLLPDVPFAKKCLFESLLHNPRILNIALLSGIYAPAYSDIFSDKTLQVPIYAENIPDNKILRTFPQTASVTFRVVAGLFNKITPRDFLLVVDYNSIKEGDTSCKLILRSQPPGVSYVRIVPQEVEYIIEQTME